PFLFRAAIACKKSYWCVKQMIETHEHRGGCGDKHPVVAWRRNGCDWLAIMPAETFARLLRGSDLVEREKAYAAN
ncbi:MAG TPA: hypothetical protein VKD89_11350, partial [Candidatus Udaeobacter sp.]|nr:hypothetical protein [Candidatus Udaeobacter sp.]